MKMILFMYTCTYMHICVSQSKKIRAESIIIKSMYAYVYIYMCRYYY